MIDIDIGKRYPDYFNQWIFRPLVFLMIALFVVALWSNDWKWSGSYIECPKDGLPCAAPENPLCNGMDNCPVFYMEPGTVIGDKPSFLAANAGSLEFLLVGLAFGLNHTLWLIRSEKK